MGPSSNFLDCCHMQRGPCVHDIEEHYRKNVQKSVLFQACVFIKMHLTDKWQKFKFFCFLGK